MPLRWCSFLLSISVHLFSEVSTRNIMGGSVSSFIGSVAKTVAKGATTALGSMIPVVGPALAHGVNSLYAKGGIVIKRFEAGGVVPDGFKAKVINTPAQLIAVIKQFPAQAAAANLSVQDVKDAVEELKAPAMRRGGEAMMEHGHHHHGHHHHGHHHHDGRPHDMHEGHGHHHHDGRPHDIHEGHGHHHHGPRSQLAMNSAPAMAMGGSRAMSGQRAAARGRGGGIN